MGTQTNQKAQMNISLQARMLPQQPRWYATRQINQLDIDGNG